MHTFLKIPCKSFYDTYLCFKNDCKPCKHFLKSLVNHSMTLKYALKTIVNHITCREEKLSQGETDWLRINSKPKS